MNTESKSVFRLRPGVWIVLVIGGLMAARLGWGWWHRPHNLKQFDDDFTSIYAFRGVPAVNHAGTEVGMVHNTSHGQGIFIANLPNKTEHLICKTIDVDVLGIPCVLGWSPDDSVFAYRWNLILHFASADGNVMQGGIETPYFDSLAWLSPRCCVYIDSSAANGGHTQLAQSRWQDGRWRQTATWQLSTAHGKPTSLMTVETNSVAWLTRHAIWQMELPSGKTHVVYSESKLSIASASYSKDARAFLFVQLTNHNRMSLLYKYSGGSKVLLASRPGRIREARWINHGKGYAYRISSGEHTTLVLRSTMYDPEKTFFQNGQAAGLSCEDHGSTVYALAGRAGDAFGVWSCDADSQEVRCLFSPWGFAQKQVHFQPALVGYARMPNHHNERFVLIPPANFSRHKTYPLIIGMQRYDWVDVAHATYSQALANGGTYVALTGYHYNQRMFGARLLERTNNVLAVYNQMMKNPNIDPNRVYLFAFSSSTIVVNRLLQEYPGRWRGIMLFDPTARLPKARSGMTDRMLVTAGSGEQWLWKQFLDYRKDMVRAGVPLETFIHPGEGHIQYSQNTLYERTLLMGKMVFSN